MSLSTDARRSPIYAGDGSCKAFPFSFKVFLPNQIKVVVSDDGVTDTTVDPSEYSVSLTDDQDAQPGGTVTMRVAPATGVSLVILSDIPYLQPMVLTNRGGFYPEVLNQSADRAVALCQQLREEVSRAISIPATSQITAEEALREILDTASNAQSYADLATAALEEAKALRDTVEQSVSAEGDTQVARVTQTGDEQVALVEGAADAAREEIAVGFGVGCSEEVWTAAGDTEAGESVTLPNSMRYVVGRHHLRMAWNGCVLLPGKNFAEVGDTDSWSSAITTLMPISAGDELMAWTVPLGRGDITDVDSRVDSLESSLADLSRRVVYKDE